MGLQSSSQLTMGCGALNLVRYIDAPEWIELAYPRTKVYSRVHMDGKLADM